MLRCSRCDTGKPSGKAPAATAERLQIAVKVQIERTDVKAVKPASVMDIRRTRIDQDGIFKMETIAVGHHLEKIARRGFFLKWFVLGVQDDMAPAVFAQKSIRIGLLFVLDVQPVIWLNLNLQILGNCREMLAQIVTRRSVQLPHSY